MTDEFKQSHYLKEKAWHGLSCCCGGGYRVGHALGCPEATREDNLSWLADDLARAEAAGDHEEIADLRRIKSEIERLPTKYAAGRRPSSNNVKGSNDRPSNIGACSTASSPHNIIPKTRPALR